MKFSSKISSMNVFSNSNRSNSIGSKNSIDQIHKLGKDSKKFSKTFNEKALLQIRTFDIEEEEKLSSNDSLKSSIKS
jgi:hypothetical protein